MKKDANSLNWNAFLDFLWLSVVFILLNFNHYFVLLLSISIKSENDKPFFWLFTQRWISGGTLGSREVVSEQIRKYSQRCHCRKIKFALAANAGCSKCDLNETFQTGEVGDIGNSSRQLHFALMLMEQTVDERLLWIAICRPIWLQFLSNFILAVHHRSI